MGWKGDTQRLEYFVLINDTRVNLDWCHTQERLSWLCSRYEQLTSFSLHLQLRRQICPHVTTMPCADHQATLHGDTGLAEDSHRHSGQCMRNTKSKPRNNTSFGASSSAVPESDSSSTGSPLRESSTGHRHATNRCQTIYRYRQLGQLSCLNHRCCSATWAPASALK